MKKVISFFVKEHLFTILLTTLIIIFGTISLFKIRKDIFPRVNLNYTIITSGLIGASPEQIEALIINPIENKLQEVNGISDVISNMAESVGVVIVKIDPESKSLDTVNRDIRNAINNIDDFPEGVIKPRFRELDSSETPVLTVLLSHKGEKKDPWMFYDMAQNIYKELKRTKHVGIVEYNGLENKELHISADPEKLKSKNIPILQLVNAIKKQNISLPAGSFLKDNEEVLIRTQSEYQGHKELDNSIIEEVENTYVIVNDAGFSTKIKDVATVKKGLEKTNITYRANTKPAVIFYVSKKRNSDAILATDAIKNKIDQLNKTLPENYTLTYTYDFSKFLKQRMKSMQNNFLMGLVLVLLLLSLFLPFNFTILTTAGIPIAILGTIATIFMFSDISLNLLSLIGLILVLGILVDDAIVVSENIWREFESGKHNVHDAIVIGTRSVVKPITASVLTTISAFAPILFMTGVMGSFVFQIPVMVIIALVFSLIEVFFMMPSHFSSWLEFAKKENLQTFIASQKKKTDRLKPLEKIYKGFVDLLLTHRYKALGALGLFLAITFAVQFFTFKVQLFTSEGIESFNINLEAPQGTSSKETERLVKPIENIVAELPDTELDHQLTILGSIQREANDPQRRLGTHFANIKVSLTSFQKRLRTAQDIAKGLKEKIGSPPEGFVKMTLEFDKPGPPQGRPVSINILGSNDLILKEIVEKTKLVLGKIDGVEDIQSSNIEGKEEWQVIPDFAKMKASGIDSQTLSLTLKTVFDGTVASTIRSIDGNIYIRILQKKTNVPTLDFLNEISVGNFQGNLVKLNTIATFKKVPTLASISHFDFKKSINISATIDESKKLNNQPISGSAVTQAVDPLVREIIEDVQSKRGVTGYEVSYQGETRDVNESFASLFTAFIFASLFTFFLLVLTFKSFLKPFLIFTTIPLGIVGVIWALILHGQPITFMGGLGIVALTGVIVNNAIIFIDFVERARNRGLELNESIIYAAERRLRPILLTTCTTVIGLLPSIYGKWFYKFIGFGGEDPIIVPLVLSLAWGLAVGSFLTMIFFPVFIRISDDVQSLGKQGFHFISKKLMAFRP